MIRWLEKEAGSLAEASRNAASWAMIFWLGHEYLGFRWPTWIDAIGFAVMGLGFLGLRALLKRVPT